MLKHPLRFASWLACLFLSAIIAIPASALPRGVTEVTSVEGITEYRLKNGMTVLLFPDTSKETVTVNVTYKVGSKHEKYGETGMAHLLEHLLFKGSKKHPDITEELAAHGAKANGTTGVDRTNYYETFAASEENINWALAMEADRMVNSFIAKEDLDKEMTVVRNEFERSENSPYRVMMQRMMAASYLWHNNGKPTIGARADIENVSIDRLQAFYKMYYQPDNAVLTVAGKFDLEKTLKRINKTFGKIRKPKRKLPKLYTVEPAQDGEKSITVRRVGDLKILASAYHIPAGSHPSYAAVDVLARVMGDTPGGRLHKGLVEKKLAVASYGFAFEWQDPGLLFFALQLEKSSDIDETAKAFYDIVENIRQNPINDAEVERAKANLMKDYELAFNSSERIAILLSEYVAMGDWRLLFLTRDRIEVVTTADVQNAAESYIVRNNRTEGRFYPTATPERIEIPLDQDIAGMLDGYKGREVIAQGEAFDPSFDNIQNRSTTLTLKSGTEIALLPKKTRGETVELQFTMQFGDINTLSGQSTVADMVGGMLMRGTQSLDRQQLSDRLDQLKSSVRIYGGVDSASGSIVTTRENLIEVIAIVSDILKEPRFAAEEFDLLQTSQVADLEASRQEPQSIVFREMRRFFAPYEENHPYYNATLDEQIDAIKAIKLADLKKFHDAFYGANQMQIGIVGDFDTDQVTAVLKEHFADWRSSRPYNRIEQPYRNLEKIAKTIDTPDKENSAMVAMLPLPLGNTHPDAVALSVGAYIYGGGFLNSRLAKRLRQNDGLSYHASAWVSLSDEDDRGQFSAYAIFAPQNREAVKLGIVEELETLLAEGVTQKELDAAKSGIRQKAKINRSANGHLAGMWADNLYLNRDMTWHKAREAEMLALSIEDVNAALKKHLNPKDLSFIAAADLHKGQKKAHRKGQKEQKKTGN